jgi:uncharacterized membrane protein SpoIIM required for sporulation
VFVSLAVGIAHWFGLGEQSGLLLMVFVIIPAVPFIMDLLYYEEAETKKLAAKRLLGSRTLARHAPMIAVLFSFFIGLTAAFTFWYAVLPEPTTQLLFGTQIKELAVVRGSFSGYAVERIEAQMLSAFETIFLHNLEVLMLILAFSLLYGAGAIFVLIWNASIIGVFLGKIARTADIGVGIIGIVPHGVFELLAYTTVALAGGIISRMIVLRRLQAIEEHQTIYDAAKLAGWAIIFLALGAFIESTGVIK